MDNSLLCNAITVYMPSAASQYIHREFKMAVNWGDLEISADASSGGEGNPLLTCLLYSNTDTRSSF